ncbi:MAG: hypothetical protein WBX01_04815 [Nitrososphaeraceae archaeon]
MAATADMLTYSITTEKATSIDLPSEFGQSIMVTDGDGIIFSIYIGSFPIL